jgi:hypothetical protein
MEKKKYFISALSSVSCSKTDALAAVFISDTVFWNVTSYNLVQIYLIFLPHYVALHPIRQFSVEDTFFLSYCDLFYILLVGVDALLLRLIMLNDTHTWHDFCERGIGPSQRPLPDNTQHSKETDIHVPSGIRTRNPSKRAAVDQSLRAWAIKNTCGIRSWLGS